MPPKINGSLDFCDLDPTKIAEKFSAGLALPSEVVSDTKPITATPYAWPNPEQLPTRPWLLGKWLLRGEVTAVVAPGGTGKSTIGIAMALSLASGREFLGMPLPRGPKRVWVYNLEDAKVEIDRQVAAASLFHGVGQHDCADRLCIDSGLTQALMTASEGKNGYLIHEEVFNQLEATIKAREIDVVMVDPMVSSHAVNEASNEAVDAVVKVCHVAATRFQVFGCNDPADWCMAMASVEKPQKRDQDQLDAMLCLLVAMYWRLKPRSASMMVGTLDHGYMVFPSSVAVKQAISEAASRLSVPVA